jgi:hypothetical protein
MNALFRSHASDGLHFMVIYILEAHARDQWPMGKTISCVDQPTTLEQRLENARECQKHCQFEMPMLIDTMDNNFHLTYGSWPFRFYVIYNGKLVLKAEPDKNTFSYHIDELDEWIDKFCQSRRPIV